MEAQDNLKMSEGYITSEDLSDDPRSDDENNTRKDQTVCSSDVLDLLHAVKYRHLDDVISHKAKGTNMEGCDYDQRTALHVAAAEGREEIVKYLLDDCGVNPCAKDRYGRAAYDDAEYFKYYKTSELLRNRMIEMSGATLDPHSELLDGLDQIQNVTLCINAAFKGDIDTLKRYASRGTDLSGSDYDRRTPLHLAAAEGHLHVVSYLLADCQVKPASKDRWGRTAADEARENKHTVVEKLILEYSDRSIPAEIQTLDPRSIELYVKALQDGRDIPNTIRINVVGNANAGKTTATRNLLGLPTDIVENTNGIDVHVHKATARDDGRWTEQDDDENDLLGVRRIAKISLSKHGSESDLLEISHEDDTVQEDGTLVAVPDTFPGVVSSIGIFGPEDPTYSTERKISEDTKAELQQFHRIIESENDDDETPTIINIWDFGGQFIFYATHQLFHSPRAVYLLVLDVSRPLTDVVNDNDFPGMTEGHGTMTIQSFCKFWLQSIHSFVGTKDGDPPVFLVGTHKDLLPGNSQEKDKQAKDYLKQVRGLFNGSPILNHIQERIFVVDDLDSSVEYSRLRSCITTLVQGKKSWNPEMPAKWIPLENSLLKKKSLKYITFEEVCQIDKTNVLPIEDEEEIRVFLTYHHTQGNIVYFNEAGLSNFVILDPQWIIDAFKCIITTSSFCKIKTIQILRQELIREAVLRPELVEEAWKRSNDHHFYEQKEILLRYLQTLGIIARARHFDVSTHVTEELDFFIVPSLLHRSTRDCWSSFKYESMNTPLAFVFTEDIVSPTLYHHITSALLGKWPVVKRHGSPQLFADCGIYQLDEEHVGIIRMTENTIELNVANTSCNPIDNRLSDHIRRFVEMILKDSLEKFNVKSDQKYRVCVKCDQSLHVESKRQSFTPNSHLIDIKLIMQQWFPNTLKTISAYRRSKKVTQRELSKLPNAIGCNWELLGISLGVSKIQIDRIKMESPYSTAVQMYHVFNVWFQAAGANATWDVLLREMADHYRVSIDWDIVRNILEDIPTEHSM